MFKDSTSLHPTDGKYAECDYVKKRKGTLCSISHCLISVMRLGKKKEKEKESEPKSQVVEGVSRLICSAKTHSVPLKGNTSA
jgi:hypothetical protein